MCLQQIQSPPPVPGGSRLSSIDEYSVAEAPVNSQPSKMDELLATLQSRGGVPAEILELANAARDEARAHQRAARDAEAAKAQAEAQAAHDDANRVVEANKRLWTNVQSDAKVKQLITIIEKTTKRAAKKLIGAAIEALDERPARRVLLTPQGEPLRQERVEELATSERLLMIAGHYEGIDERVIDALSPLRLSIGDFVVSGGELPAMLLVDAIARLQPSVLGHELSSTEDSFSVTDESGSPLLDCPHYTRPRSWRGREVPEVLLGGDHAAIEQWRLQQRRERTQQMRPDLRHRDP